MGTKINSAHFHAVLKNFHLTLLSQGKEKKKKKKDLHVCCIINRTDNTGKKLVRRERAAEQ